MAQNQRDSGATFKPNSAHLEEKDQAAAPDPGQELKA